MTDLGYNGPKFTWSNCQEGEALVQERLDRGVANSAWKSLFPEAEINIDVTTCSDHAPVYLSLIRHHRHPRHRPHFFFEASWTGERGYREVIETAWDSDLTGETSWKKLDSKLEACTRALMAWRKNWSGPDQVSISKLQKSLLRLQTKEDARAENEIKKIQKELGQLLEKE